MTASQALEFIHSVRWQGSKPGLSRTYELLERLKTPVDSMKYIHIAGTNGKGSTAAMTAKVLQNAGYRTGLYISPYLFRFNERMSVDGEYISDEELALLTEKIAPHAMAMADHPTEFELVTALGLEYFALHKCDFVVLEVGMGGRLDSTNTIKCPECAVITNIGLDHVKELGNTVELIAAEKAGIIKPGCDTVVYDQKQSVIDVVAEKCRETGSVLHRADFSRLRSISDTRDGQVFAYRGSEEYSMPLLGLHQLKNAAVVLETVDALRGRGFDIPESAVKSGLAQVVWPARFEILSRRPWFVVDGGHNPQCAETVAANIADYFPGFRRVMLLGVLADKDFSGMTDILNAQADEFITVTPQSPRAMKAQELAAFLQSRYGKRAVAAQSIEEGVRMALDSVKNDDNAVAVAVGSLYMSGPIRACFGLK